jgi:hypothetical protein
MPNEMKMDIAIWEKVWVIELPDGRPFEWTNARFVTVFEPANAPDVWDILRTSAREKDNNAESIC